MTLVPAYGRDYKSKEEVIADYEAGHDFQISDVSSSWHGAFCSKTDFIGVVVKLRYDKLRKAVLHTSIVEGMI